MRLMSDWLPKGGVHVCPFVASDQFVGSRAVISIKFSGLSCRSLVFHLHPSRRSARATIISIVISLVFSARSTQTLPEDDQNSTCNKNLQVAQAFRPSGFQAQQICKSLSKQLFLIFTPSFLFKKQLQKYKPPKPYSRPPYNTAPPLLSSPPALVSQSVSSRWFLADKARCPFPCIHCGFSEPNRESLCSG